LKWNPSSGPSISSAPHCLIRLLLPLSSLLFTSSSFHFHCSAGLVPV
jgi:hypothetical protein